MIKFHDYNPDKPFKVTGEFHYISDGKIFLDYTPKQGTMVAIMDGKALTESATDSPKAGEFYIDYAVASEYKQATQVVLFNEADNGKRVDFDYEGVSTIIKAEHMNEIRDFMNTYKERRAFNLIEGKEHSTPKEQVELFSDSQIIERIDIPVKSISDNVLSVDSFGGVTVGKEFTLADKENFEIVLVKAVNTKDRTITVNNITKTYSSPHLYRTTTQQNGSKEETVSGVGEIAKWSPAIRWQGREEDKVSPVVLKESASTNIAFDGQKLSLGEDTLVAQGVNTFSCSSLCGFEFGEPMGLCKNSHFFNGSKVISPISTTVIGRAILGIHETSDSFIVPRLYCKTVTVMVSGVPYNTMFLSASPVEGYVPHPAFIKDDGSLIDELVFPKDAQAKSPDLVESSDIERSITFYQLNLCLILRLYVSCFPLPLFDYKEGCYYVIRDLVVKDGVPYFRPFVDGDWSKGDVVLPTRTTPKLLLDKSYLCFLPSSDDNSYTIQNVFATVYSTATTGNTGFLDEYGLFPWSTGSVPEKVVIVPVKEVVY